MRKLRKSMIAVIAATMAFSMCFPAMANEGNSGRIDRFKENRPKTQGCGNWIDQANLTWQFENGETATIGTGQRFSDEHPEITDPEYYLKQWVLYPGETSGTALDGTMKSNYSADLPLLRKYLQESDWIHKTEAERFWMIYDRLAVGHHGNKYAVSSSSSPYSLSVFSEGEGICRNYAADIERLAKFVGLESVTDNSSEMHETALVKVNGQWLYVDGVVDTGSNPHELCYAVIPVDFDTEYKRHEREYFASDEYKTYMSQIQTQFSLQERYWAGEMTAMEYYREMYKNDGLTDEQIKALYSDMNIDWNGYWKE